MKIWLRSNKEETQPHNINIATAMYGFQKLGADVVLFNDVHDIYDWLTPNDIVVGYLSEVEYALSKFNVVPKVDNYPSALSEYLGRKVWQDKINNINNDPSSWGIFIKPIKEKAFTGKVINSLADLVGCGSCYENYDVLCSEPIDIKAEWRCFVRYDEILDIRPYGFNTDYHYYYDYKVVEGIISSFKTIEDRPMGCSIDVCVTGDNRTLLVEVNDGYSLAAYGLDTIHYAKLISARCVLVNE